MSEYEIRMWAIEQAVAAGAEPYNVERYAIDFMSFVFPPPESMKPNLVGDADAVA